MKVPLISVFAALVELMLGAMAQTWCGKHYKPELPIVPPGGQFPIPSKSTLPLLALRCSPAIRPYLPEDVASTDPSFVSILVDAPITFSKLSNAAPIHPSESSGALDVTISVDGKHLTHGIVKLNSTRTSLPFSLRSLQPRTAPYNISCSATFGKQKFLATGLLSYLPDPPSSIGSVTKMDLRTGALLARPANGKGPYAPVLPIGFYTQFDGYLAKNLSISAELAAQGFTIVHPIPTFSNLTALDLVLDKMQDAGLYLMYDMRGTYQNQTSVTEQVNRIKSRPNLLLWYTADEPDGTTDPLNATVISSNLITSLDGGDGKGGAGYHPVSLVLNCQDYFFNEYTSGSDIVMQDAYMIGNNLTFSTVWNTVCTKDYGDCGCDNCLGKFEDISTRMDEFRDRLFINGWDRTKAVWTVPQGFGNETYWKVIGTASLLKRNAATHLLHNQRYPTGKEFVVESILGINHGGLGVVSWDDPTTPDIKASASLLALSLPKMTPYILSPVASFRQLTINRVDVGLWTVGRETLVLASNMNYATATVRLVDLGLHSRAINQVLNSGAVIKSDKTGFTFESVGSGAFVVKK
ncbi:hypothetical protein D9615_007900 [Tricholomella constricta]|uniref:Uncharacterized protein n=1 Tax=Tricholomella constricta TaxID=117010 RepID=A0A8H5M105_9AGAR|nr:hypothetical protein D9615_007900 [Tricholomella constricta]